MGKRHSITIQKYRGKRSNLSTARSVVIAVRFSPSAIPDRQPFPALCPNMGYDGDLELAMIPESFRTDVLKEKLDDKGVLIENSDVELASFALLFEFDGDQKHIRHVLYNCSASRPGIEGKTNEDSKEIQTETLAIKAAPLANGMVKAKTGNTTDATAYNDWYKAVYMPTAEAAAAGLDT